MLTKTEVCEQLRISPKTFKKLVDSGELTATRIGTCGIGRNGAYRVAEEDLDSYIKSRQVQPETAVQ